MGDLCTTQEVKDALEITASTYDTLIATLITAASAAIENRCQREFIGGTETRMFTVRRALLDLAPHDLRGTATVVKDPEQDPQTLSAGSDYLLWPPGGSRPGGSYQQVRFSPRLSWTSTMAQEFGLAQVSIAGTWGVYAAHTQLDYSIKRAAVLTVASWLDRAIDQYAMDTDGGREMRPDPAVTFAIPASAHQLLAPWARIGTT